MEIIQEWHFEFSLCYFAESNAKALLTAGAYQKCIAPCRGYKGVGKSPACPYAGSACYVTDRSGVDGTNCILQSENAYAIMSVDKKQ
mgnify:CR=1 FL=1